MFYYRITARRPRRRLRDGARSTATDVYVREYAKPHDLGDFVVTLLGQGARSVRVDKISQAAYVRATRPGE